MTTGRRPLVRAQLGGLACGLVALVWLAAGALKLIDPAAFARDIEHYRLVPAVVAATLSVYLPWLELVLGVGLCLPGSHKAAQWLSYALLGIFCTALVSALVRGLDVRCGCLGLDGGGRVQTLWLALARDLLMIALLSISRPPRPEVAPI